MSEMLASGILGHSLYVFVVFVILTYNCKLSHNSYVVHNPGNLREYFNLCGKLLTKMIEPDSKGQPQILHGDQIIQKAIQRFGGSTLYEIRMAGKNRLYFVLTPKPDPDDPDVTARIAIVGSHNGDESTQREFINNLLR